MVLLCCSNLVIPSPNHAVSGKPAKQQPSSVVACFFYPQLCTKSQLCAWFGCVWAKIKKFRKPAFLPGLKPRLPAGNSVKRAWCRIKSCRKNLPNSKQTRPCPCRERKRRRKNRRKTKSPRRLKRPKNRRKKTPRLNRFPPYRHRRTGVFLRCLSQPPQQ